MLLSLRSVAQYDKNTFRQKNIYVDTLILKFDTLSILPQSFKIHNVTNFQYLLDPISATIFIIDTNLLQKSVVVEYITLSADYSKSIFHKSPSIIEPRRSVHQTVDIPIVSFRDAFSTHKLQTNGYISRGISTGTNQDIVLNSSLNLQMSGKLSENIEVIASISDKNIPIQPEGNTQFIQDINSIFITLKIADRAEIKAGDIIENFSNDDFLKFNRNFLGLQANVKSVDKEKVKIKNSFGGGVAKGKFSRQNLNVQNGVQGPYRLYGNNNEISMSIVAGSERVYLDGRQLTRGQDNDYTIDYNTSEITFTPKILVTKEKRFVVEFEYSDRHFVRYGIFSNNELEAKGKFSTIFCVNFFHEQDMKNQSIQPELSNNHKMFLSNAGDNSSNYLYNFFEQVSFLPNQVHYKKYDTLHNNIIYTIYKFTLSEEDIYSPSFSYVGANNGNYRLKNNNINGRVFEWVAPINGVPQGDYEAALSLTPPSTQQMLAFSFDTKFRPNTNLKGEVAFSHCDKNLFSKLDEKDDLGISYNLLANNLEQFYYKRDSVPWFLFSSISLQFVHKNFAPFESFRDIEFARDFNLAADYSTATSEWLLNSLLKVSKSKIHDISYSLNFLLRPNNSKGLRNEIVTSDKWKYLNLKSKTSFLISSDSIQKTRYLTSYLNLSEDIGKFSVGIENLLEYNKFLDNYNLLLRANGYFFNDFTTILKNSSISIANFSIQYRNRVDFLPNLIDFYKNTQIHEAKTQFNLQRVKNQSFQTNIIYRYQTFYDTLKNASGEHYFVGNLSYTGRFFKNVIILNTYYEAGSGMEQKKIFTYLKVAKGQGTHIWNDYNNNGIEEIEEFELAVFQDQAEYIKVWIANNEYLNTYNGTFSQSILIRPAVVWHNKSGFRKFVSRFSNSTNFRTNLKHLSQKLIPISLKDNDSNVIAQTSYLSNNLSFNDNSSKFAFEFMVQRNINKQFLYYGFENSVVEMQEVTLKSLPIEQLFIQSIFRYKQTSNTSSFLSRNFVIECYNIEQEFRLQINNIHNTVLSGGYLMLKNLRGKEKINTFQIQLSYSYRLKNKGLLQIQTQYVDISGYAGENSAISYNMLNGLSIGRNLIWDADFKFSITEYLQLAFIYSGRAVPKHKVVHSGNVTINALF